MKTYHFILIFAIIFSAVIAFGSHPNLIEANGPPTALTQLTNDGAINVRPAWSPDNRFIAYQSNRDANSYHIYVMDADGKNMRALTKGSADDRHPFWTPDGKSIVFDSFDGKSREIWMVNVSDGALKQITRLGGLANFPSSSPDQQRIAFYFYKDDELNLWTIKFDGSDAKALTRDLASARENQCTFACHVAAWSPDSQMLVYTGGEHETIWASRSDGTDVKRIVSNEEHNHFPWFLPDGRLGYITEHVQPGNKAWTDAWVYNLKTGEKGLMQEQMAVQGPFSWSNDTTRVLFHSPRSGNFNIFVIDLNAPGGLDVLQGKSTPASPVRAPDSTASTGSNPQPLTVTAPFVIGAITAVGILAIGGLLLFKLKRRKP